MSEETRIIKGPPHLAGFTIPDIDDSNAQGPTLNDFFRDNAPIRQNHPEPTQNKQGQPPNKEK